MDDATEDARINDLEHLLELGRVARLLEGQEQAIGLVGGGDHGVEFGHAPSEGFLADGVVTGVEGIDGGLRMEVAGQGVDHQVDIAACEEVVVVGVCVAAHFALGALAAILKKVGDGDYLVLVWGGLEVAAMDVEAGAALTENGDADGFFFCRQFGWLRVKVGVYVGG